MRFLVICLLATIFTNSSSALENSIGLLEQGVQVYQKAIDTKDRNRRVDLFSQAQAIFSNLVQQQSESVSAELYLNLGNAALGAEDLGQAILAYHQALAAQPKNARAQQNLQHARSLLPDWIPQPEDSVSFGSFFDWAKRMRPTDWFGLAAITFMIALAALAIYVRTDSTAIRNAGILAGCLWLALLLRGLTASQASDTQLAVVTASEITVRSADSINAPARFAQPLVGGAEVKIVTDRDDWLRIQLFDGREGWVPRSALLRI